MRERPPYQYCTMHNFCWIRNNRSAVASISTDIFSSSTDAVVLPQWETFMLTSPSMDWRLLFGSNALQWDLTFLASAAAQADTSVKLQTSIGFWWSVSTSTDIQRCVTNTRLSGCTAASTAWRGRRRTSTPVSVHRRWIARSAITTAFQRHQRRRRRRLGQSPLRRQHLHGTTATCHWRRTPDDRRLCHENHALDLTTP